MREIILLEDKIVKNKLNIVVCSLLVFLIFACNRPNVKVIKAEFAKNILFDGGIACVYTGKNIIKITLDFNFQNLITKEQVGSDAYKSEVYQLLSKNAQFYCGDSVIEPTHGYWPEKITKTSASKMVLFYVIPNKTDLNKLKFEYNASILGGQTKPYSYSSFFEMKPLSPEK
jgi:hypothetical protein